MSSKIPRSRGESGFDRFWAKAGDAMTAVTTIGTFHTSSQHYTGTLSNTTVAVLAEKPSVARDIASVLGATARGEGYLHGNGYVVTWAIGHLAALAQPHEIRPEWRAW